MSSRQKACYEDECEAAEKEAAKKFAELKQSFVRAKIEIATDHIRRLQNDSSLALTQNQWYRINAAFAALEMLR